MTRLEDLYSNEALVAMVTPTEFVGRVRRLEAVAHAARVAVAMWHDIGAGTKWALCDETQALADALDALDEEGRARLDALRPDEQAQPDDPARRAAEAIVSRETWEQAYRADMKP